MRRWLALLVAATTSLVLIALLVPMALLIRAVAENGAMGRATAAAESVAVAVGTPDLELAMAQVSRPVTVFLPDGRTAGRRRPVPTRCAWPRPGAASLPWPPVAGRCWSPRSRPGGRR